MSQNPFQKNRRDFLRLSAQSACAVPLAAALPISLRQPDTKRPLRIIFMFTPNGMVRKGFWPDTEGKDFDIKPVLQPLEKFRDDMLILRGICNRVRGDGDNHMRGMSCFLTGIELFPGNVQGGSHRPAGWARGISIDQEIKNYLQSQEETRTRFGSLEFGICVRGQANPWTRWVYAGANQPIAPISNPYEMYEKMFGAMKEQANVARAIALLPADIDQSKKGLAESDRGLLDSHQNYVRQMQQSFESVRKSLRIPPPELPPNIADTRDNMPQLTKMQIDLLVNGFANDLNRVATLQFTESVGQPVMKWLGIKEGHHALSHDPDLNEKSQEKLTKINRWYCEQLAYLVEQLRNTRQRGSDRTLFDDTLIIWANELGHGNSHTLDNIPIVMIGGDGFGFEMGRYVSFGKEPHNRLWLTIAHAMGHQIKSFGNPRFCKKGPLELGND
jgi:hypothetical protein